MFSCEGVAYNGIEGLGVKDKDVLIIGAGPIGLLGTAICKALGKKVGYT